MKMGDKEAAQKTILYAESILKDAGDDAPTLAMCVLVYIMHTKNVIMDGDRFEANVKFFPGVEAVHVAARGGE